jgi:hypothetical protein
MEPEEVTGQDTGQVTGDAPVAGTEDTQSGGGGNVNPAWNDLLGVVPEMLHSQVTPHLEKWDRNYQESLNKVHSQYAPYKPYLEGGINPDQINYALQLVNAIDERPADVIQALQEYAGIQQQQQEPTPGQQGQVEQTEVPEWLNHPEFKGMKQMVETMAQLMVQQNYSQQEAMEDQMLSDELDQLHETHGDFDEEWVLTRAANNPSVPLEDHVKAYHDFVTQIRTESRRPPGPRVMGAGGVAPDNQVDVKTLDDKGRRGMVAQLLAAAAQQND